MREGDVYYVDLFVRRIRLLEQLLPFTRPEGSTFVSEEVLAPTGETDAERDRQNAADMVRSEETAAVVALRELGYDVVATPRGVLVTSVSPDVPAAAVLDPGDVIVAVDGTPVKTPAELRAQIGRRKPGDDVRLTRAAGQEARRGEGADDREPGRPVESDRRDPRRAGGEDRAAVRRRHRPRSRGRAVGRASVRARDRAPARSRRHERLPDRGDRERSRSTGP